MSDRLAAFLRADKVAMRVLEAVRVAGPANSFVAAGFIRNRVWDSLYSEQMSYPDIDIDVVYFDQSDPGKTAEKNFEVALDATLPTGIWQVRNQARMHTYGGHRPFNSLDHALTHWAETATAVGVRLSRDGTIEFIAPFGFEDLWDHILRISPIMKAHDPEGFESRLQRKKWQQRWPRLQVIRD